MSSFAVFALRLLISSSIWCVPSFLSILHCFLRLRSSSWRVATLLCLLLKLLDLWPRPHISSCNCMKTSCSIARSKSSCTRESNCPRARLVNFLASSCSILRASPSGDIPSSSGGILPSLFKPSFGFLPLPLPALPTQLAGVVKLSGLLLSTDDPAARWGLPTNARLADLPLPIPDFTSKSGSRSPPGTGGNSALSPTAAPSVGKCRGLALSEFYHSRRDLVVSSHHMKMPFAS